MLDVLTAEQLAEWQAYDAIDPIHSEEKEDVRQGHLLSFLDNWGKAVHAKRGSFTWSKPSDFVLRWNRSPRKRPEQTMEQQKDILMAFAATARRRHKKKASKKKASKKKAPEKQ